MAIWAADAVRATNAVWMEWQDVGRRHKVSHDFAKNPGPACCTPDFVPAGFAPQARCGVALEVH